MTLRHRLLLFLLYALDRLDFKRSELRQTRVRAQHKPVEARLGLWHAELTVRDGRLDAAHVGRVQDDVALRGGVCARELTL